MLSVRDLSKSYGTRTLFEKATFTFGSRERVGLVGRNGHGKTTLLNIIAGLDAPDDGAIIVPRGYKIGYLTQKINFSKDTVHEEAVDALPEEKKESPYLAEKILFGLGFRGEDMRTPPDKLSGGYQVRLNLAKLLISGPDLLLLDEPTNYLDILSVRWLKGFLLQWKGELVVITHDREFMDSVVTHIVGIHRQRVRKLGGNTEKYYAQLAQDEEIYEKTRINDEAKRKDMELYIARFRAKARLAGLVQSRIKALARMEKKDRLENISELDFSFRYKDLTSRTVLQADNISFGYETGKPLFSGLSFTLDKGDRLCIIGRNGAGKSTLLKVLAGILSPQTGRILGHNEVNGGYFEQTNVTSLHPEATVEEEVAQAAGYGLDRSVVRAICGCMLFSGEDALKRINVLSGGEKCRVMLAKIVATPCSYLLLDEPTNHLDMDAADSLLEALEDYPGAVALVTHNEAFLNTLANKLIVFQGESPFYFDGTYPEFLSKIGWAEESITKKASTGGARKDQRRLRAELVSEKGRALKPLSEKMQRIEDEITAADGGISALHEKIDGATASQDGKALLEFGSRLSELTARQDALFEELNDVTVEHGRIEADYEARLRELEE